MTPSQRMASKGSYQMRRVCSVGVESFFSMSWPFGVAAPPPLSSSPPVLPVLGGSDCAEEERRKLVQASDSLVNRSSGSSTPKTATESPTNLLAESGMVGRPDFQGAAGAASKTMPEAETRRNRDVRSHSVGQQCFHTGYSSIRGC